jgi:CRP-like cAMP-binding protein
VRAALLITLLQEALSSARGMMETGSRTSRSQQHGEEMVAIQSDTRFDRLAAAAARPLAELLECPQEAGSLLSGATRCIDFDGGTVVFRQHGDCKGLYVVVSGDFARKAERFDMRVTLGSVRPGDLVELAATLGDGHHTYTLSAVTPGSLLLLPIEALRRAFESYPPLRMRLLEELAREVSRAYITCCLTRVMPARRHGTGAIWA